MLQNNKQQVHVAIWLSILGMRLVTDFNQMIHGLFLAYCETFDANWIKATACIIEYNKAYKTVDNRIG